MKNERSEAQSQTPASAVRFPSVSDSIDPAGGYKRRDFLKIVGATTGAATLISVGITIKPEDASAFAYEPYLGDDQLTTVVTSCAHNCGSRHVLVPDPESGALQPMPWLH